MFLFPPMRFRFAEADHATYGDGWHVWDEQGLAGLPARELIALERLVDMSFPAIVRGFQGDDTMATLAAMWIVLHREGHPVLWPDFNPVVHLATWEAIPAAPLDSGEDPAPDSGSSVAPSENSVSPPS